MKINWKDIFYFEKRDRIAIVFLLAIVLIVGVIRVVVNFHSGKNQYTQLSSSLIVVNSALNKDTKSGYTPAVKPLSTPKMNAGQVLDINQADINDLKKIPGIGNTYARRIVFYRDSLGGFYSLNQLFEIKGIKKKLLNKISPFLIIRQAVKQIDINHVSENVLRKHPYLSENQVNSIINYRKTHEFHSINDLKRLNGFTQNDLKRLLHYFFVLS